MKSTYSKILILAFALTFAGATQAAPAVPPRTLGQKIGDAIDAGVRLLKREDSQAVHKGHAISRAAVFAERAMTKVPSQLKHRLEPLDVEAKKFFDEFATDLTEKAMRGSEDIPGPEGCDDVFNELIAILNAKDEQGNAKNPMVVGHAGSGKTWCISAFAHIMAFNQDRLVPELQGFRFLRLDLNKMKAGTKDQGEFEKRISSIETHLNNNKKTLIFIDEVHQGAPKDKKKEGMNALDLMKPAMQKHRFITATTEKERSDYIDGDEALARRMPALKIEPPSPAKTLALLKKRAKAFAQSHGLRISDEVILNAILIASETMKEKLPASAWELITDGISKTEARIYGSPVDGVPYSLSKLKKQVDMDRDELAALRHKVGDLYVERRDIVQARLEQSELLHKVAAKEWDDVKDEFEAVRQETEGLNKFANEFRKHHSTAARTQTPMDTPYIKALAENLIGFANRVKNDIQGVNHDYALAPLYQTATKLDEVLNNAVAGTVDNEALIGLLGELKKLADTGNPMLTRGPGVSFLTALNEFDVKGAFDLKKLETLAIEVQDLLQTPVHRIDFISDSAKRLSAPDFDVNSAEGRALVEEIGESLSYYIDQRRSLVNNRHDYVFHSDVSTETMAEAARTRRRGELSIEQILGLLKGTSQAKQVAEALSEEIIGQRIGKEAVVDALAMRHMMGGNKKPGAKIYVILGEPDAADSFAKAMAKGFSKKDNPMLTLEGAHFNSEADFSQIRGSTQGYQGAEEGSLIVQLAQENPNGSVYLRELNKSPEKALVVDEFARFGKTVGEYKDRAGNGAKVDDLNMIVQFWSPELAAILRSETVVNNQRVRFKSAAVVEHMKRKLLESHGNTFNLDFLNRATIVPLPPIETSHLRQQAERAAKDILPDVDAATAPLRVAKLNPHVHAWIAQRAPNGRYSEMVDLIKTHIEAPMYALVKAGRLQVGDIVDVIVSETDDTLELRIRREMRELRAERARAGATNAQ